MNILLAWLKEKTVIGKILKIQPGNMSNLPCEWNYEASVVDEVVMVLFATWPVLLLHGSEAADRCLL